MNFIYHLKLYKSSSKPIIEITTAKKPMYKKLLSACPRSLVDIKNAIEHAIPPNGGTYLEAVSYTHLTLPTNTPV